MTMTTTKRLNILEDCKDIMSIIFKLTKDNPEYRYNINDQLIRSGLSIGSNIAEANQRYGNDKIHHYNIALGSLEECRFQLYVYPNYNLTEEIDDIFAKIKAVIHKLKNHHLSRSPSLNSQSEQ